MKSCKTLAVGLIVIGACAAEEVPPAAQATSGQEAVPVAPVVVEPEPAAAAVPAPAPAPVVLTAEQLLAAFDACDAAWLARDEEQLRGCYADSVELDMVDSGMAVVKGAAAAVDAAKPYWAAFEDLSGALALTLLDDHSLVVLRRARGTHTGELMGIAPTNKSTDMVLGAVVELTPDGKVKAMRDYGDMATLMGQLGQSKAPHRKAKAATEIERVTALSASDSAQANEQLARDAVEAWNAGDYKKLGGFLAKDWLLADQLLPADLKGDKALAMLKSWRKGFPDAQIVASDAYTAGDYVAFEQTFSGTNTGTLPQLGVKKATGQSAELRFLQIFKIADGKIAEIWQVGNGMALAQQLGLLPTAGASGAEAK